MPFFRRKSVPAPLPGPHHQQQHQQQQQHWVAYMYAPHQPVAMPSMYPLQTVAPYGYLPPNAKYALHRSTLPVQYFYQTPSSAYSNIPTQLVHSSVETDYHHHHQTPRQRHRPASGTSTYSAPTAAPFSRGSEHGHYTTDSEYAVDIHTQPAKHGVLNTLINFARGRSKSRGRGEVERPRSRGALTDDDGHGRGRATDPRYATVRRARRLSGEKELKKAKHESLGAFDKSMESLEKSLRAASLTQEDPYRAATIHRSTTKEDLKRKYEEEDRLQDEYQRAQQQAAQQQQQQQMRNNRARSPDVPQSPTLIKHTQLNARPHYHHPDAGYHTDAPAPRSARRQSVPLALPSAAPAPNVPEGFFNRRGDQLMNSKGDVLRRPPHMEYPPEFAAYPHPGTGWRDHKGQVSSPP